MKLTKYEQVLLDGWEETHKKSQLTFWILFSLYNKGRHMNSIKETIHMLLNNTFTVDDQSMYRALRRLDDAELIEHKMIPNQNGPSLKMYYLTTIGINVLRAFSDRNVSSVYFKPEIEKQLIKLQERK